MGGNANCSAWHSLLLLVGWNFNQTLDSGSFAGDFDYADTAASRISFVRGADLGSGTDGHASWQKAGGVRGLLAVLGTTDNLKQFPLMDRLGNVTGYKKASVSPGPAVLDAVIEYDALGREVRSTGPASDTMPFRFSTKYTDPESGLVYYGYRFYDPDRGRWVNRDPLTEIAFREVVMTGLNEDSSHKNEQDYDDTGTLDVTENTQWEADLIELVGINDYALLRNRVVNNIEMLGLAPYSSCVLADSRCSAYKAVRLNLMFSLRVCTRRNCFFRCYCDENNNCPKIPCPNRACPLDHGVEEKILAKAASGPFWGGVTSRLWIRPWSGDKTWKLWASWGAP